MRNLSALFSPKSVTIIGASENPQKVGAIILKNILASGFSGNIYPVNPKLETAQGLKCYRNIENLPETPDLAIIAISADKNPEVLTQIGEKGIKNAICIASGFKESGEEGKKLEDQLLEIAKKYSINLLGPNCLGLVNNDFPINATFGELVNLPGNLRFISQSGAIAASIFDFCKSTNLGFSQFVTLGNKADLNENDILEYFLNNQHEKQVEGLSQVFPVGLYLESISDGPKFLEIAKQISKMDPIFIIKPGKTQASIKAMQSHTGAIAGEDSVLEEALQEAGIIRCESLEDFFDLSRAFSLENIPTGPKVGIVSNAGGPAVISADAIVSAGLELAELDEQTKKQLAQVLPRSASILNPVDVLGDALAERFIQACEIILQNNQVDALVAILTPQVMTQIESTAQGLGVLSKKFQKPIFCAFLGGNKVFEGEKMLNLLKIPVFKFPERAIYSLGQMWKWKKSQQEKSNINSTVPTFNFDLTQVQEIIRQAVGNNQKALDNLEANKILSAAGIPTPDTQIIADINQAKNFVQTYNYPVVLKLSSPNLLHKNDAGGVLMDIRNEDQLEDAWETLQRKITQQDPKLQTHTQIQIQKEVTRGVEMIMGVKRDINFGPVLLFGAGGTWVELINDRNLHLLPIDTLGAKELVEKSKVFALLKGSQNHPALALDKLYEAIVRLGKLAQSLPEIIEIEINPLIVTLNNVWGVDGKVVLRQGIHQEDSVQKFQTATTISHTVLAPNCHFFVFEADSPLNFHPGQYISVKLASNRANCYSIAGHEGQNKFSLLVDTSPGGSGSKFFASLKAGDKMAYLGPFGTFALKEDDSAKHVLFLGTGSGLAPLKSMIEAALKEKNLKVPITLYLGVTSAKDIFLQDYLQKLSQDYPNFNFKIAVWQADESWQGNKGFITELLKEDIPDASNVAAYLCGNKNMIADATKILLERSCPKERIYTEKY